MFHLPANPSATLACRRLCQLLSICLLTVTPLMAAPPATVHYETHVAPIFQKHCVSCHNPQSMKAELDLSTPEGLFRGSESGQVVDLENGEEGLLYEMVHGKLMPPEDKPALSANEIETLDKWVKTGMPFKSKIDIQKLMAAGEVNQHDIEPLLLLRCAVCHGLRTKEGGLDLRRPRTHAPSCSRSKNRTLFPYPAVSATPAAAA